MRGKLQTIAISATLLALIFGATQLHRNFHHPNAWIERSPANPRWAVDIAPAPGFEITQIFRVHDLSVDRFRPVTICSLYSEHHSPDKLHWSRDGSVAAIIVSFVGHSEELYGCAYDFREHREYTSPLARSPELSEEIRQLVAARGGVGKRLQMPDPPKAGLTE